MDETNKIPNPYENLNPVPPSTPIPNTAPSTSTSTSKNTKTIVTILLLIFLYPIGFFVMWFWSGWKVWVKLLVSFFGTLATLLIVGVLLLPILLASINPVVQMEKAERTRACQNECLNSADTTCVAKCLEVGKESTIESTYVTSFKKSYLEKCSEEKGATKEFCECTLKYLEDNQVDITKLTTIITELPKAAKACENLLN